MRDHERPHLEFPIALAFLLAFPFAAFPAGVRLHLVDALADQDFGSLVGRIGAVQTVQLRVLETYKYHANVY